MSTVTYVKTGGGSFLVMVNGTPNVVGKDHPMYRHIDLALANGDGERAADLLNIPDAIRRLSGNHLEVNEDGSFSYMGYPVESMASQQIIRLMEEEMPFLPLLNYLGKLVRNPSAKSQKQLYPFMVRKVHRDGTEHVPLPICTDGDFLAYKSVQDDWTDWHSGSLGNGVYGPGKYRNMPGDILEMPRQFVDDEPTKACSSGFHVGSLSYVRGFHAGEGRIVVTKQSPEDVVSVPHDLDATKCRVCRYVVLREYQKELLHPVYAISDFSQPEDGEDYGEADVTPLEVSGPALRDWDRPSPFDEY